MFVWRSNCWVRPGKGHEYFLKHFLGTSNGVLGKGFKARPAAQTGRCDVARRGPEENSICWSPSISACRRRRSIPTSFCRPPPGTKRTTSTPPTCIRSFTRSRRRWIRWECKSGLGYFQSHRQGVLGCLSPEVLGVEKDVVLTPSSTTAPAEMAQPFDVKGLVERRVRPHSRQDRSPDQRRRARLPQPLSPLHLRLGRCDQGRQWRQRPCLEHGA